MGEIGTFALKGLFGIVPKTFRDLQAQKKGPIFFMK